LLALFLDEIEFDRIKERRDFANYFLPNLVGDFPETELMSSGIESRRSLSNLFP
jgi:hypothetical protein